MPLWLKLLIPFILAFVILVATFFVVSRYVIFQSNQHRMNDLLAHNLAMHKYVENVQKPVIYDLKKEGVLSKDYFDPKILSFTYMVRHVLDNYNTERMKRGEIPITYKLASDNPRHIPNQADKEELKLLKAFNDGEISSYHEIRKRDGLTYTYFALPIDKTRPSCMKCHGDPNDAPKGLIDRYGDKRGFGESIGKIRAFISLEMPIEHELDIAKQRFFMMTYILFVIEAIAYALLLRSMYQIQKRDQIINKKNEELKHLAQVDALTKAYNRRSFNKALQEQFDIFERTNQPTILIIFDIDFFKSINDSFGHLTGDSVLVELVEFVKKHSRSYDKLYRIGGEEFAIIVQESELDDAFIFAEKLREGIANYEFSRLDHNVTVSVGVAQLRQGETQEEFFTKTDEALYRAKENGRNSVEVTR
jgi:diguanylate cyclase (GGDEF)-like protein